MTDAVATRDFVHPKLGLEVTAIGGHYVFGKEIRLSYHSREILYYVGYAVLDSTCCGVGGCAYVYVPGFVQKWKYKRNEDEADISEIDPIRDRFVQKEIRRRIQKKEMVFQVSFD
jgi:hypothetical protein